MNVAILLSCGSFEGFFGRVQGHTRDSYLANYRGDWSWYYAAGLLENGIKPTLYIPSLYETGKYPTDTGIDVRFLPLARWYKPMEQIYLKRASRITSLSLYCDERLNTIAFMKSLKASLIEDKAELLYVQEYWSGRFDHLAHRISIPVTAADHGGLSNHVIKWFKRRAFEKTPIIYCQTEDECQIVQRFGGTPRLQPNGCDTSQFVSQPNIERRKSILSVARLTNKQKRTSDLIQALALLPQDWTLDIVGTGPDMLLLKRCAAAHNVSSRVTFHGFLSRSEVRRHLQECGVFAMPSSNEAVAIAALEAMGCGCSVVLSRIRAFESLVRDGENGRLVPVGDPKALASAILAAWSNRERYGPAAAATVRQRFDTRKLYAELARSLRAAVSGQPSANRTVTPHAQTPQRTSAFSQNE